MSRGRNLNIGLNTFRIKKPDFSSTMHKTVYSQMYSPRNGSQNRSRGSSSASARQIGDETFDGMRRSYNS